MPVLFDGIDGSIGCGTDSSLNWGAGDGSVAAWIKFDAGLDGFACIVINGAGGFQQKRYILFVTSDEYARFDIDDDVAAKSVEDDVALNDGEWHLLVGVRDGNNLRLYVDGVESSNSPTDITGRGDLDNAGPLTVGASNELGLPANTAFFEGEIDEVSVWPGVALSASQILDLYNAKEKGRGLQVEPTFIKLNLPLDDGEPESSGDTDSYLDTSWSGNDGTGSGGVTNKAGGILSYPPSKFILFQDSSSSSSSSLSSSSSSLSSSSSSLSSSSSSLSSSSSSLSSSSSTSSSSTSVSSSSSTSVSSSSSTSSSSTSVSSSSSTSVSSSSTSSFSSSSFSSSSSTSSSSSEGVYGVFDIVLPKRTATFKTNGRDFIRKFAFEKTSAEQINIAVDFSAETKTGQTLASSSIEEIDIATGLPPTTTLLEGAGSLSGDVLTQKIKNGVDSGTYKITYKVTDIAGNVLEADVIIYVLEAVYKYTVDKQPAELITVSVDFANWLTTGENITAKTVTADDISVLSGLPILRNTTISQKITNGTDVTRYELTLTATTDNDQIFSAFVVVYVDEK